MIAFVTILLGLLTGTAPVEIEVGPGVAAVELRLDGESVGRREGPPWKWDVDLGERLTSHELAAVAFDGEGEELARVWQRVNVPREPAAAELALLADGEVRLSWESVTGDAPVAVRFELDGRPLEVATPERFFLPPLDLEEIHFLRAELDFVDTVSAVAERVFGGGAPGPLDFPLTALPVASAKPRRLRDPKAMQGWFSKSGEALRVVAVEKGAAELVFVLAAGSESLLAPLAGAPSTVTMMGRAEAELRSPGAPSPSLEAERPWRAELMWSVPFREEGPAATYDLFPHSQRLTPEDGELWRLVAAAVPPIVAGVPRLADAVAVAGLTAAAGGRRRLVILIASGASPDESDLTPSEAVAFLADLAVPLEVWSPAPGPPDPRWGEPVDVSTAGKLERAVARALATLDEQRIAWLEGDHLVRQVAVTGAPVSVTVAGR